jgi:hypothetical protein
MTCSVGEPSYDLSTHAWLPILLAPPPRRRCLLYLHGILSDVARKNGWQLAEQAGESRPDGMQRLLTTAVWDENGVRDELRTYVLAHLRDRSAVVAIDETSFRHSGKPVSRSGASLLWQHETGRALSGRGLSLLHQHSWPHAARPGTRSSAPLAGRSRSLRKSWYS